jgi:hypothetical protein
MHVLSRSSAALAVALAVLAGCKKQEQPAPPPLPPAAPALGALTLGSAIGTDKRVTTAKDTFAVRDTLYVSIPTTGSGNNAVLKVVWTFGAETVRADSMTLNLGGPSVTEFHISRPRAWPTGAYQVAVTLNGGTPATRPFVVK